MHSCTDKLGNLLEGITGPSIKWSLPTAVIFPIIPAVEDLERDRSNLEEALVNAIDLEDEVSFIKYICHPPICLSAQVHED